MNRENTIDYIEIPAADLPKAQAFFSEVFGWTFEDFGPEYCSFSDGRIEGGFYQSSTVASTESGSVLVVFYRADLEGAEVAIQNAGGQIIKPIFSFPGGRRFHFSDPNGNEYAIWSDQ